jgi:hypothetical protein
MSMIVHDEDPLYCSSHPKIFIIVLQPLETRCDRRVLLRLCLLRASSDAVNKRSRLISFGTHLNVKFDNGYLCCLTISLRSFREVILTG